MNEELIVGNKKYCHKHGIEYSTRIIKFFNKITEVGICEECKKEVDRETQKKEEKVLQEIKEADQKQQLIKLKEMNRGIIEDGNLPLVYLEKKLDTDNSNYKKYSKLFIDNDDCNLYVYGSTGVGKTHFLSKLALKKLELRPLYIDCQVFLIYGYKQSDFLNKIKNHKLIILDEAQAIEGNEFLQNIIYVAYLNGAKFYFASNIDFTTFCSKIPNRILSRIQDNNLRILNFTGKDLRIAKR